MVVSGHSMAEFAPLDMEGATAAAQCAVGAIIGPRPTAITGWADRLRLWRGPRQLIAPLSMADTKAATVR